MVVIDAATAALEVVRSGDGSATSPGCTHALTVHGVRNPGYAHTSVFYNLTTHMPEGNYIDELESVKAVDVPIVPNDITDVTVSLLDPRAGATTDGNLRCVFRNSVPPQGIIALAFPIGFVLPPRPQAKVTLILPSGATEEIPLVVSILQNLEEDDDGDDDGVDAATGRRLRAGAKAGVKVGASQLSEAEGADRALSEKDDVSPYTGLILQAQIDQRPTLLLRYIGSTPTAFGAPARIDFFGVRTPLFSQTTGRLEVITTTPDYHEIDIFRHQVGNQTVNVSLLINPNAIDDGSVTLEDSSAGALTAARFTFHIFNYVPYLGQVCISLPPNFRFYGPASGFSFGGISRATSTGLGVGLVVERYGGGEGTVDDHRVCIHRRGDPGPSKVGLIDLRLTNIIVPLDFDADGRSGNFTIETKTEADALIDVLTVPFTTTISSGRYAPAPPPEGSSGPHGSSRSTRRALLWAVALSLLSSVWLHGEREWWVACGRLS